jgi:hypothetical protein
VARRGSGGVPSDRDPSRPMCLFPSRQCCPLDEPDRAASSPKEDAIFASSERFVLEQNDEWAIRHARYMTLETIAPLSDDLAMRLRGNRRLPPGPANAVSHRQLRDTIMTTFIATHCGGFFAEVPVRSKLRDSRRCSRTTDIFRRRVESSRYFHQDARDVQRTVGERAEGAAGSSNHSPRPVPLARMPASIKPPRSTWLVSSLRACLPHDEIC